MSKKICDTEFHRADTEILREKININSVYLREILVHLCVPIWLRLVRIGEKRSNYGKQFITYPTQHPRQSEFGVRHRLNLAGIWHWGLRHNDGTPKAGWSAWQESAATYLANYASLNSN